MTIGCFAFWAPESILRSYDARSAPTPSEMPPALDPAATTSEPSEAIRPLLTRLSVALNRRRAYATAHPMVTQAETELFALLSEWLATRGALLLGVAHQELMVNGAPLDSGVPVARELAERLHRRGVGALHFQAGLTIAGLREAMGWLAFEPLAHRAGAPATAGAEADTGQPPAVPGLVIGRVAYDRLTMADDDATLDDEVNALWRTLATAVFDEDEPASESGERSVDDVAQAIERRAHQEPFARRVSVVVLSLANQVTSAPLEVREELAARLRAVLEQIGEASVGAVVHASGNGRAQRQFLVSMINALPPAAVVEWLEVSARATHQELSHHVLRLLAKLSAHADQRRGDNSAAGAVRDAATQLVHSWTLDEPDPPNYGAVLEQLALHDASRRRAVVAAHAAGVQTSALPPESARLVQMACEIDCVGEAAVAAAQRLVSTGESATLFAWLSQSPHPAAAQQLRSAARAPAAITTALLREPFDAAAARALLQSLDAHAAPVLLDVLERSPSRSARRVVYDRLREFGPEILSELRTRLEGNPPWYFTRNVLALLRDGATGGTATEAGAHASLLGFLGHAQEQVRVEALRLLLESEHGRDAALRRGLDDVNDRVLTAAIDGAAALVLENARDGKPVLSKDVAVRLMRAAERTALDDDTRAKAIRSLAGSPSPTVRDWLLSCVTRQTRLLRRVVLADASPVVLSALQVLASGYAREARVAPVLAMARQANDARRGAVSSAQERA